MSTNKTEVQDVAAILLNTAEPLSLFFYRDNKPLTDCNIIPKNTDMVFIPSEGDYIHDTKLVNLAITFGSVREYIHENSKYKSNFQPEFAIDSEGDAAIINMQTFASTSLAYLMNSARFLRRRKMSIETNTSNLILDEIFNALKIKLETGIYPVFSMSRQNHMCRFNLGVAADLSVVDEAYVTELLYTIYNKVSPLIDTSFIYDNDKLKIHIKRTGKNKVKVFTLLLEIPVL